MSEPIIEMANPNSGENVEIEMEIQANDAVSAAKAEAYAVGERNGVPVTEGDPAYHNNAKYYTEMAQHLGNLTVDATTGAAGSEAEATVTTIEGNPHIDFTIPRGDKGDTGNTGATPNISIGTVTDLPAGSTPTATMTGTAENPVLNLGLVHGQSGNETIDDTAGIGDTDLVFSADKVTRELNIDHPEMSVGTAGEVIGEVIHTDADPYIFRRTANGRNISGSNRVKENKLIGGTVAWNQAIEAGEISTVYGSGVTYTHSNGAYTLNGTPSGPSDYTLYKNKTMIADHVYLLSGCPSGGSDTTYYISFAGVKDKGNGVIFKQTGQTTRSFDMMVKNGYTASNLIYKPNLFDLTQMFGSVIADTLYAMGDEGIKWFRKYFPADYYAYDAGSLVSVKPEGKRTNGFNLFDKNNPVEINGYIAIASTATITSENATRSVIIPCLPNTTYYVRKTIGTRLVVMDTDGYPQIGTQAASAYSAGTGGIGPVIITTGANAKYLVVFCYNESSDTQFTKERIYGDLCINISSSRNGEYEPYTPHLYPLAGTDLRGIPSIVNGKLSYDGDEYTSNGKILRKYGIVDLGTLTWSKNANYWYNSSLVSVMKLYGYDERSKLIAEKYTADTPVHIAEIRTRTNIIANFTSALGGIMVYTGDTTNEPSGYLVYELKTPTIELATPFTTFQTVSEEGTEEYIDTRAVVVPVGHITQYLENTRKLLKNTEEMIPMFGSLSGNKTTDNEPYLFRQCKDGIREEETLVGGTVAWNQKVPVNKKSSSNTNTDTRDCCLQMMQNVSPYASCIPLTYISSVGVFNYLFKSQASFTGLVARHNGSTENIVYFQDNGISIENNHVYIFTIDFEGIDTATVGGVVTDNAQLFDLTQMFGSTVADAIYAMEQATAGSGVAWFRSLFPKDYYAYNAGELMSVQADSKVTTGINIFDITNVLQVYNGTQLGTEINLSAGTKIYYQRKGGTSSSLYGRKKDGTVFSIASISQTKSSATLSTDITAIGISTSAASAYGENDILMVSLTNFTEVVPYSGHTYPLDSNLVLRGIPKWNSTSGKMYYDGDQYKADGTVARRYGIVDLGSLTWNIRQNTTHIFYASLSDSKKVNPANAPIAVCAKYKPFDMNHLLIESNYDKVIGISDDSTPRVYVNDSAYSDAATFKTAMSGVYLVYELATTTTETADPFAEVQICDPAGTEEYIDTRDVAVPVGHETTYHQSMRSYVDSMLNQIRAELT